MVRGAGGDADGQYRPRSTAPADVEGADAEKAQEHFDAFKESVLEGITGSACAGRPEQEPLMNGVRLTNHAANELGTHGEGAQSRRRSQTGVSDSQRDDGLALKGADFHRLPRNLDQGG